MTLANVTLEDKYTLPSGRVFLSGIQALVRLPMMQQERDRAAGLRTAGYISGYRGSPLAGYDTALHQARQHLAAHDIHFQPGVNEDLAATALWGTQQVNLYPTAKFNGVFGIWYGKGPGVDRSMDPLKHANLAGTSRHGGVLAIAGDDHGCQSSTTAHQSEPMFLAAMIPLLNPATVQEYLDYGLYGFALSRFAGVWVGFKAISETVESSASIAIDPQRLTFLTPADFEVPPGGLNIRWPDTPLDQERRLHGPKMAAVAAFARANPIDQFVFTQPQARLGIVAAGKAYLDLRQALDDLGLSEAQCLTLGLRLYKVGMVWPLEAEGARRFADGLEEILVVEEKRGFIEDQLMRALYNLDASRRPRIVGKTDETGASLLPSAGELAPTMVARALVSRLERLNAATPEIQQRMQRLLSFESLAEAGHKTVRLPYFCAGCPHNTSTRVPDGSRALAGIGCHFMAIWMPRATSTYSHMGGEGAAWIGQAPFTEDKHVFQNLGDGTYSHSGLLAIRAAAVAGVNITYKILYNDAVAMTGGQTVEGSLTVGQIARQVSAEGAKQVVVVTDEPDKYPSGAFPPDVHVRHRDELDQVQRALRDIPGLTVLIYDQTCAAEKRRRRKRGTYPDPAKRVFINEAVCEGCGDCSDLSNCIAVKPLETEFGRKRVIDQSSCNKDFSCLKGFCPSFVTVHGGELRRLESQHRQLRSIAEHVADIPPPAPKPLDGPYNILIAGIGGTGVITIGATLGMAAHLDGKGCSVLDFTGLAQKNGAVLSHVRIAPSTEQLHAVRVAAGSADLVLGCDMVVAASATALTRIEHGVTRAIVNSDYQPTAAFMTNPDVDFETAALAKSLRNAAGEANVDFVEAARLASALLGDSIAANVFLLGYAVQKGLVPLSIAAIERAIELNGAAVEMNKHALAWGRLAAHDTARVAALVHPTAAETPSPIKGLASLVERRGALLVRYQNAAYAARYRDVVDQVERSERARLGGRADLAEAVAENLFKLMAYKDEYEVARLYTDGEFLKRLRHQFTGDYRLEFHLAPPTLAKRDPATGELQKQTFGPWMFTAFRLLARLKFLRGTALDPFGRTPERRLERQLVTDYCKTVMELLRGLTPANRGLAVEIARIPERIRGFGHVKEQSIVTAKAREAALLAAFRAPAPEAHAAE